MKIIVESKEEKGLIIQLCDVGLKAGGMQNLQGITLILNSIEEKFKEKQHGEGNTDKNTD